jgi:CubicO group peptidase (beta-lactamase class C family)
MRLVGRRCEPGKPLSVRSRPGEKMRSVVVSFVSVATLTGLGACSAHAPAQPRSPATAAFDAMVDDVIARYDVPGIAVGVVQSDEVIYMRTAGELVAGSGEKVTADTLFKIASNTKAMTTAVLARLVDVGKLRWDDPVARYLPNFAMHDPWVTREMQVRDLVIHNSGLRSGAGDLMLWPEPNTFTRADIIAGLAHLKPVHSFRSHYDYDNLLYIVAGEVAAAAAGVSYEELVRRELFEPLQMRRCRVGEFQRDLVGNIAQPHMRQGDLNIPIRRDGEIVPAVTMAAAGGVRCSLKDMLTWVRVWLADEAGGASWLSAGQREALWTAHTLMPLSQRQREWDGSHFNAYGYGWRLSDVDGVLRVAHTGTLAGMYSAVTMLPENDVGFVLMINGEGGEARTVLNQALTKHFTAPDDARTVADYAADLARERAAQPAAMQAPDVSVRNPATAAMLGERLGVYRDSWFGGALVCAYGGQVRFSSRKSPKLDGEIMRVGDRMLVDWLDDEIDAEAWLDFSVDGSEGRTTLRLGKVDPEADFSYDYEDLAFTRVGECP